jgi:hypothetical protein
MDKNDIKALSKHTLLFDVYNSKLENACLRSLVPLETQRPTVCCTKTIPKSKMGRIVLISQG